MRLNVVRSPLFADHDSIVARSEDNEFMDIGIHKMNYMLITHSEDFRSANVVQKALILNNPPLRIHETYHEGSLPLKKENVSISSNQVILTVLKPSEDKNSEKTVIRLYESFGKEIEVNLVIPILNLDTKLTFKAFEIKSLLVDKNGSAKEINLIEQIIEK